MCNFAAESILTVGSGDAILNDDTLFGSMQGAGTIQVNSQAYGTAAAA